jgi:hypothetical protein
MLTGNGCDKWFDKSFTLVIGKNGKMGFNAEHAFADAPIMAHCYEYMLAMELTKAGYAPDGRCKDEPAFDPPEPIKLKWQLPDGCLDAINVSYEVCLSGFLLSAACPMFTQFHSVANFVSSIIDFMVKLVIYQILSRVLFEYFVKIVVNLSRIHKKSYRVY